MVGRFARAANVETAFSWHERRARRGVPHPKHPLCVLDKEEFYSTPGQLPPPLFALNPFARPLS
jgi:hypothetical protein